jgi:hypothetical protein
MRHVTPTLSKFSPITHFGEDDESDVTFRKEESEKRKQKLVTPYVWEYRFYLASVSIAVIGNILSLLLSYLLSSQSFSIVISCICFHFHFI